MTIEEVKQIRQRAELCAEVTVPGEHLRALCDLLLETEAKLREVEEERDQAREALRSVRSLCRDKSFPGTMNMRLDEIERHVCKALVEG